jgi:hypothetical protein
MAVSVTPNIVAGSRLRYGPTGGAYVTVHDVWGLSASADNLVTAIGQGISARAGSRLRRTPSDHSGFLHGRSTSRSRFKTQAEQASRYFAFTEPPSGCRTPPTLRLSAATAPRRTALGHFGPQKGNPIIIGYAPQGGSFIYPLPPPGDNPPDGTYYNFALYEALSPNTILRITRRDAFGPMTLSRKYRRTVNSDTWLGGAPGTWLCRGIDGKNLPVVTSLFPGVGILMNIALSTTRTDGFKSRFSKTESPGKFHRTSR